MKQLENLYLYIGEKLAFFRVLKNLWTFSSNNKSINEILFDRKVHKHKWHLIYVNKTFCNYFLNSNNHIEGAIAGIVIVYSAIVAVIIFLIIYFILRNKMNKEKREAEVEMNQDNISTGNFL